MRNLFFCIDGHTAGNPVRLVAGGGMKIGLQMSDERMWRNLESETAYRPSGIRRCKLKDYSEKLTLIA